jgi:hypothetical protein
MKWHYGLFLFSVQNWFLVSVSYCSHVLYEETKHITKDEDDNNINNNNNNNNNKNNIKLDPKERLPLN